MDLFRQFGLTFIIMAAMLYWFFFKGKKKFCEIVNQDPFGDYPQPKNAQTLGVLGTFIGITIGLLTFNPDQSAMHDSVMNLLGGMSTAFLTSIAGMVMYLWLSNYQDNAKKKAELEQVNEDVVDEDASIADLIRYLKEENQQQRQENAALLTSMQELSQFVQEEGKKRREDGQAMLAAMQENNKVLGDTISKAIADVQRSVVGDGDYTVIGQMKQMRLESRDEITKLRDEARQANEELIKEFREFAKTMAENNTKAFIEALNETMKDFNTKLTEQFGENFKQLNEAVGRLLDWQIKYKETVEEVTATQREIFAGIEVVRQSMQHVEESAASMTESANKMADIIVTANTFNEKLAQALTDLQKIGGEAQNAVPNIISLVDTSSKEIVGFTQTTMETMQESTQKTTESLHQLADKSIEEANRHFGEIGQNLSASAEQIADHAKSAVETTQAAMQESMQKTGDSIEQLVDKGVEEASRHFDEIGSHINNSAEQVANHAKTTMDAMQEVAQKTGDTMQQLTDRGVEEAGRHFQKISELISETSSDLGALYQDTFEELNKLAESLKENSHLMEKTSDKALNNLSTHTDRTIQAIEDVSSALREASRKAQEDFAAQSAATSDSVRKAAESLQKSALNVTRDISDQLEQMMKTNNESLKKSSENLSKDLDAKITSSLESMGNAMGSISQKFANDYRPIAQRLKEIVELANTVSMTNMRR